LKDWLTERVYRPARSVDPGELLRLITGQDLSPQPWLAYVKNKYSELYGLD
jgi:carboxypeptidase Taq